MNLAARVNKLRSGIDKLLSRHLLATNVTVCSSLLGLGDCFVQRMEITLHKGTEKKQYNFARTGRMIMIGFMLGPFNHYWYAFLDKILKGSGMKTVLKKIACDQVVAGPFFCTSFLCGMGVLEGKGVAGAKAEWKEKFLPIYMVDWAFWPLAQVVNFRFLPLEYRVIYVNCATLIWNTFLSYMKHKELQDDQHEALEDTPVSVTKSTVEKRI